jgi:hypothetical protein
METVSFAFLIWCIHAVIGAALSAPILLVGRKRIGCGSWELLAVIVPFCLWLTLMISPLATGRKSLGNTGEVVLISIAMPMLALARVAVGKRIPERVYAASFIMILCLVAAAVFFMVPMKPE